MYTDSKDYRKLGSGTKDRAEMYCDLLITHLLHLIRISLSILYFQSIGIPITFPQRNTLKVYL